MWCEEEVHKVSDSVENFLDFNNSAQTEKECNYGNARSTVNNTSYVAMGEIQNGILYLRCRSSSTTNTQKSNAKHLQTKIFTILF